MLRIPPGALFGRVSSLLIIAASGLSSVMWFGSQAPKVTCSNPLKASKHDMPSIDQIGAPGEKITDLGSRIVIARSLSQDASNAKVMASSRLPQRTSTDLMSCRPPLPMLRRNRYRTFVDVNRKVMLEYKMSIASSLAARQVRRRLGFVRSRGPVFS